jgi:hypothetical protein
MQLRPFIPKDGILIQMDVVFLPPIPTGSFRKFSSLGVLFSWFLGP